MSRDCAALVAPGARHGLPCRFLLTILLPVLALAEEGSPEEELLAEPPAPVERWLASGDFRELPPLQAEDVPLLVQAFVTGPPDQGRAARQALEHLVFSASAEVRGGVAGALLAAIPPAAGTAPLTEAVMEPVAETGYPAMGFLPWLHGVHTEVQRQHRLAGRQLDAELVAQKRRDLLRLAGLVASGEHAEALAPLLRDEDVFEAALDALWRIPGDTATRVLAAAIAGLDNPGQERVIHALGRRGDPAAVPVLREMALRGPESLTWAALEASAALGAAPPEGLRPGPPDDFDSSARYAGIVLRAAHRLAEDGNPQAAETLYRQFFTLHTLQYQVRAALIGLSQLGSDEVVRYALGHLSMPAVQRTAVQVLTRAGGEQVETLLLEAYRNGDAMVRASLLEVLERRQSPRAPALIAEAEQADVPELRFVAAVLGGGMAREEDLAYLAGHGAAALRPKALRAFLDLAHMRAITGESAGAARQFRWIIDGPFPQASKREALEGLGQLGLQEDREIVGDYLDDPWLGAAAYAALARISAAQEDLEAAEAELTELARRAPTMPAKAVAVEALARLGADTSDFGKLQGYLSDWKVLGPFPNPQKTALETAFFPESRGGLLEAVEYQGVRFEWQQIRAEGLPAVIDLEQAIGPYNDAAAYLATSITVPRWTPVEICVGADEAYVCWLNGAQEFINRAERPFAPDLDCFPALLRPGINRILLKVLQNQGPWKCTVRIVERAGTPLDLSAQRLPEDGLDGVGLGAGAARISGEQALP